MNLVATFMLAIWIPAVLVLFTYLRPRTATVTAAVSGWLILPPSMLIISGLPDFSKFTATNMGVFLGALIYDRRRLTSFRPRWFDLPVVVWCLAPIASSLNNGLGIYDGLSAFLNTFMVSGLPYFLGRVYFSDAEGLKELTVGMMIGGLAYIVPCLIESWTSPIFLGKIYKLYVPFVPPRFGLGYRPAVLLSSGLELGMWMNAVALVGYWTWASGSGTKVLGLSARNTAALTIFGGLITKSVGAVALFVCGVVTLWISRRLKSGVFVLLVLLVPPAYMYLRASGTWSGDQLVRVVEKYVGKERAESVKLRLKCEDALVEKALRRKIYGWGGHGRSRIYDEHGKDIMVTDGFWVIVLGNQGLVGLTSVTLLYLLPGFLLLWRAPVEDWSDERVAPAAVLALLMGLYMIDNLFNAMANPIYALAVGGVMGAIKVRAGKAQRQADLLLRQGRALRAGGDDEGAEESYRAGIGVLAFDTADPGSRGSVRELMADCHAALADLLLADARPEEAEGVHDVALDLRAGLVAESPEVPAYKEALAADLDFAGRLYQATGRPTEARDAWLSALGVWERLVIDFPGEPRYRDHLTDALNDLAWGMTAQAQASPQGDPGLAASAVEYARKAVEMAPMQARYWNTLGMAYYQAGDWAYASASLDTAVEIGGGTAFDHFPMAVCHERLGDHPSALRSFRQAVEWMSAYAPDHPDLARLRGEAGALLGVG